MESDAVPNLGAHFRGWIIIGLVLLCVVLICACYCSRSCGDRDDEADYKQLADGGRAGQFHTNQVYEHAGDGPSRRGVEVNPSYDYAGSGPV